MELIEAPVDVFKRLGLIADGRHVSAADFHFFFRGLRDSTRT